MNLFENKKKLYLKMRPSNIHDEERFVIILV